MAVTDSEKPTATNYRVVRRYRGHAHILVRQETGRTHQIGMQLAHIPHPMVGDPVYIKAVVIWG